MLMFEGQRYTSKPLGKCVWKYQTRRLLVEELNVHHTEIDLL